RERGGCSGGPASVLRTPLTRTGLCWSHDLLTAMRYMVCLAALLLAAPLAHAQALTVERDGDTVTITRPDGTTEQFTIGEDAPLRVRSHDGAVIVEEDDGAHRRIEVRRHGAPRAFAFDADGPRGSLRMALDLDSLA